jgi:hypothetical protein
MIKRTLTASQLMVIVDCLHRSLRVANYSGTDGITLNVVEDKLNKFAEEHQWNETGQGV